MHKLRKGGEAPIAQDQPALIRLLALILGLFLYQEEFKAS